MKLALLFSGGKDSTYAGYLAKQHKHTISCLITISSENKDSFMFHTPSISQTKAQAKAMNIPIITISTKGKKELELTDLEKAIKIAKSKYHIQGIVTGAVESIYQAARIQKICDKLDLECFNPLWQKDQFELLNELIKAKFDIIITAVAAYPLNEKWLGRKIDKQFILDIKHLNSKYKINPAGEGGETESFVLNCPLFKKPLKITNKTILSDKNSHKMEIEVR